MTFVKVNADPCEKDGTPKKSGKSSFKINIDLISAINGQIVFLKGSSNILKLKNDYYTNLTVLDIRDVEKL